MRPNENFNSGRFMQYLAQDLKRCVRKAGLTTFACSLAPAIILAFTAWSSSMGGNTEWKIWLNISDIAAAVVSTLFFLRLPITCYGHLTDKRKGAAHLMLPASHTEKYVSMILVGIVIFPLAFALMYLSVDAFCSVLFPTRYEGALAIAMAQNIGDNDLLTMFFTPWMVSSAGLAFQEEQGSKDILYCGLVIHRTADNPDHNRETLQHSVHISVQYSRMVYIPGNLHRTPYDIHLFQNKENRTLT